MQLQAFVTASDDTAGANFSCYDEEARMIIHHSADTLRNLEKKNPGFPQEINALISKEFTFAVGLTNDSFYDVNPRTYQVKYIMTGYGFQAVTERHLLLAQQGGQASSTTPVILSTPSAARTAAPGGQVQTMSEIANPADASVH